MTMINIKPSSFLDKPDDLNYLEHVEPKAVKFFVEELNSSMPEKLGNKKLVAVIGTGGTISMKVKDGIRVPDLDFESIFSQVGQRLGDVFDVVSLDAFRIDSSQMNYSHIRDLAIIMTYVWNNLEVPFKGFLIPHGTDTMAYSAASISLIMGQGLPFSIVYTGAQKSIQEKMNDATSNLRNALYTLEALNKKDMAEVVVVMGDKAILGTSSVKVNDTLANAFDAPLHKYVSSFSKLEYPVRLAPWLKPKRNNISFKPTIMTGNYSRTLVVHSSLGLCPAMVERQVGDSDIEAVLLFSYGAGTVDDNITNAIVGKAQERSLPVFVVSPVNTEYKIAYESGKKLIEMGVTPLYMTLPTALAKIEIALNLYPDNPKRVAEFMTTDYVGEIPSELSRFSPILER